MRQQVLFLQGGGAGAHDADAPLATSLQHALGDHYRVWYPQIPNEEQPEYHAYRAQIAASPASPDAPVILVGHSLGGFFLVRFLSEKPPTFQIAGLFLIAAPYVGMGGWQDEHYAIPDDLAARIPAGVPIYCYHSRDDETVPFSHLALYAQRLPQAVIRLTCLRWRETSGRLSCPVALDRDREMANELPVMGFENRDALRRWLEANHASSPGIVVRMYRKHSGTASVSFEDVLDEGLCFGWSESLRRTGDAVSYLQTFTPRRRRGTTSERNRRRAAQLIREGRMTPAGLAALGWDGTGHPEG
jgi:hypothetical protein